MLDLASAFRRGLPHQDERTLYRIVAHKEGEAPRYVDYEERGISGRRYYYGTTSRTASAAFRKAEAVEIFRRAKIVKDFTRDGWRVELVQVDVRVVIETEETVVETTGHPLEKLAAQG